MINELIFILYDILDELIEKTVDKPRRFWQNVKYAKAQAKRTKQARRDEASTIERLGAAASVLRRGGAARRPKD